MRIPHKVVGIHTGNLLFLLTIAALGLGLRARAADEVTNGLPIRKIESPDFAKEDVGKLATALGLHVGSAVNLAETDQGIRNVIQRGDVQTVFIEGAKEGQGLRVILRGSKKVRLRTLVFRDINHAGRAIFRNQTGLEEGRTIDVRLFPVLRDRLRSVYQDSGYYRSEPDIRIQETDDPSAADVVVSMQSGPPARVGKLTIAGNNPLGNAQLEKELELRPGAILEKGPLERTVEQLRKYLRDNQFQAAKVEEASLDFSSDMTRVDVVLTVRYGDRLQYLFRGNRALQDRELRALLTEDVLSQPDPSARFAELISTKYHQIGFYFCKVVPIVQKSPTSSLKYVEMRIDEGHRVRIDALVFPANSEENEDLEGLFYNRATGVLHRGIYREDAVRDAVAEMRRYILAKGYLNSRISEPKAVFTDDGRGVELIFDVELGKQTFVSTIVVTGNTSIPQSEIEAHLKLKTGQPLSRDQFAEDRKRVLELYAERGFVDVKFENSDENAIELSADRRLALARYPIVEGRRYRVGTIHLEGNRKTQSKVVLREMKVEEGDVFAPNKVRQSEEAIGLLGLFSRIDLTAETDPSDPNRKNIRILVRENRPGVGEIGLGGWYEAPRLRVRSFVGFAYRNLFGLNQTATARTELGLPFSRGNIVPFIEYSATLGYRAPYPFGVPVTFAATAGLDSFEITPTPFTLTTRASIQNRIEKQFFKGFTFIYRLHRYERTTTEIQRAGSLTNKYDVVERVSIGSTGPSLIVDLRDDTFNPTRGSYHTLDVEFAHPAMLSQADIGFVMASTRNSFYLPLFSPFKLLLFAGAGFAKSLFDESAIPTVRLAYDLSLGGQTSIRGFTPRSISPPKNTHVTAYLNGRAEMTIALFSSLSLAVFFDSGQILPELRPQSRHDGVGLGFRYKTPVGPVVIDFAQGFGGANREPVRFYFTVGTL